MAKFEVELDDQTGKPVGDLPEALQKFYDLKYKQGEKHGAEIAEAKARKDYEAQLAALKRSSDPLAEEKIKGLEDTLSKMREAEALREKRFDDAIKERDSRAKAEREAIEKDRDAAKAETERRTAKLQSRATAEIRAEAVRCGALDSALDDIAQLLVNQVGLDTNLEFFVKDAKDPTKPRVAKVKGSDGKEADVPVTIAMLVEGYLAEKTHYVKAGGGNRSGGARNGKSLTTSHAGVLKPGHEALEAHRADIRARQTNDTLSTLGAK
jgi:hypothetical protein